MVWMQDDGIQTTQRDDFEYRGKNGIERVHVNTLHAYSIGGSMEKGVESKESQQNEQQQNKAKKQKKLSKNFKTTVIKFYSWYK